MSLVEKTKKDLQESGMEQFDCLKRDMKDSIEVNRINKEFWILSTIENDQLVGANLLASCKTQFGVKEVPNHEFILSG